MCRLACNVCGGITAVEISRRRFIDLTLLCMSLDWRGILDVLSPLERYHLLDFSVLCGLYISVLATYAPYLQYHTIISAVQKYHLLLSCYLFAVSLPRLTLGCSATAQRVKGIKYPWYSCDNYFVSHEEQTGTSASETGHG